MSLSLPPVVIGLLNSAILLLGKGLGEYASKLRRELTPDPLAKDQLLIIRSPADEASGGLNIFQFLSQITIRLFLFGESCYANAEDLTKHPRKLLRVGVFAFVMLFASDGFFLSAPWLWLQILGGVGLFIFDVIFLVVIALAISAGIRKIGFAFLNPAVASLGMVVAMLTWLIIPLLSLLLVLPFGWQAALANILLDVTAESTPPGSWEIHLIEPPTSEEIGVPVPPLMHRVYENPRVHRILCAWIETRGSGATKIT